jgi:shikimate kinase/3-dehydroquinate synthase
VSAPESTLLLGGFMGAGKSTVGRLVAELAGVAFVDLDALIEAEAGATIPEIFATRGEAAFRALEATALERALSLATPQVIALGGGALLDGPTRRRALERATVVTLTASARTLAERTPGQGRPLLDGAADREARIGELLRARNPAYAEAHARVATDDRAPAEIARAVLAVWRERRIQVALGAESYAVRIGADVGPNAVAEELLALAPSSVVLAVDSGVATTWGAPIASALAERGLAPLATLTIAGGDTHKTLAAFEAALRTTLDAGADRKSVVVAVGGGVTTDLAGFVAATLYRGIRWIAVPTTLLAMVDASVGGKTGVDLGAAKNAVGAFHQPSAVVIDAAYVTTQSPRDYRSGLAEVVKTALVGDASLLGLLENEPERVLAREAEIVTELARRSIAVKAAIVGRDPRETGERALLNLGHTLGHALEAEGGFRLLTHGEAVGLGTIAALHVGVSLGVTERDLPDRIAALLGRLGLPVTLDAARVDAALELLVLDKKRVGDEIRAVLVRRPGEAFLRKIPLSDLAAAFRHAANFARP